jgi:1-acyl-sn-glycerol-3-phosphate acyltransferase
MLAYRRLFLPTLKFAGLFCIFVFLPFVYFTLFLFSKPLARHFMNKCYGQICRFLGFKIHVHGKPLKSKRTLFVANHISYLDILILGNVLEAPFASKSDIRKWPIIGWIAKLQQTVFISRHPKSLQEELKRIREHLVGGANLILFPEGTSTNGARVAPFKNAFFEVLKGIPEHITVLVQPVTLKFTRLNNVLLPRFLSRLPTWIGDSTLFPHLWSLLRLGGFEIEVTIHEPLSPPCFPSRAALSQEAWRVVSEPLRF